MILVPESIFYKELGRYNLTQEHYINLLNIKSVWFDFHSPLVVHNSISKYSGSIIKFSDTYEIQSNIPVWELIPMINKLLAAKTFDNQLEDILK